MSACSQRTIVGIKAVLAQERLCVDVLVAVAAERAVRVRISRRHVLQLAFISSLCISLLRWRLLFRILFFFALACTAGAAAAAAAASTASVCRAIAGGM